MKKLLLLVILFIASSPVFALEDLKHLYDNSENYYTIIQDSYDDAWGGWDDPTQSEPDHTIGQVACWLFPEYSYTGSWNKTWGTGIYTDAAMAGDYCYCYLAPAYRSDLKGYLYIHQMLGSGDLFGNNYGVGNRDSETGWGTDLDPEASTISPNVCSLTQGGSSQTDEKLWSEYRPAPLDEKSVIQVTWQQKVEIRAEFTHKFLDSDQESFLYMKPTIIGIDGSTADLTVTHSSGEFTGVSSLSLASFSINADGASVAYEGDGQEVSYNTLTVTGAVVTDDGDIEKTLQYSVQDPGPFYVSWDTYFEWACRIDDNNSVGSADGVLDKSSFRYAARINTDVIPKKIFIVTGTQGKPAGEEVSFTATFRSFVNDANLLEEAFGDVIDQREEFFDDYGG